MVAVKCHACGWKGRRGNKSKILKVRPKGAVLVKGCPKCGRQGVYVAPADLGKLVPKGE